jgi:acetyl esterase
MGDSMVHAALQPILRVARENPRPHPSTVSVEERRTAFLALATALHSETIPLASVTDDVARLDDARELRTRLYVPINDEERALVLYFHGGSFCLGNLDSHDAFCRRLSADTGMRVLAVDYRLAPECPFPGAINDAAEMFHYVASHWSNYASPEARMIVMGDSAGGSLVAVASVLTKDVGLDIASQVLIYPTLGPEMVTASAHEYGAGYLLDLEHLRYDYQQYLGEFADHTDPRVSPLMFADLTGAPPAIVLVAECDPLRDEGLAYAGLLEHFGVPVEILEAKGMVHGFLGLGGLVPEALDILDDLAERVHHFVDRAST